MAKKQKEKISDDAIRNRAPALIDRVIEGLNEKQRLVVVKYSSKTKLQSVIRWKQRMAKGHITVRDLAKAVRKPEPRISEWLNLKFEPTGDNFEAVESALYKMGV